MGVKVISLEGVTKFGTAGSAADTAIPEVEKATLTIDSEMSKSPARGNGGWQSNRPTIKNAKLDFEFTEDKSDPSGIIAQMETACIPPDTALAFSDQSHSSGQIFDADFYITSFQRVAENASEVRISVSAEINCDLRQPQWTAPT